MIDVKALDTLTSKLMLEPIQATIKRDILRDWRGNLINIYEDKLMDKDTAEIYFEALAILDKALVNTIF